MSEKKRFLLRLDSEVYDALERWASGELRSVNSQIEYLLREALVRVGRLDRAGGTRSDTRDRAGGPTEGGPSSEGSATGGPPPDAGA